MAISVLLRERILVCALFAACCHIAATSSEHAPGSVPAGKTKKLGIKREISTVDLNKDLALAKQAPPTDTPKRRGDFPAPPVFRANSFTGAMPAINPADLQPPEHKVVPERRKSFSIAPPRRETSQADLNHPVQPKKVELKQVARDAETAAAEEDLKKEVLRTHGIVLGQVSPEEVESWNDRIIYTGKVLGVGGFSVVHAATDTRAKIDYAVKVVKIPSENACFVRRLIREVRLLQELDHPNIVRLHKVLEYPETCHLFMEHCQGGELLGLMENMEFDEDGGRLLQFDDYNGGEATEFSEPQVVHLLHQVLQAVKHCHDRNIAHRDLKLENVLLCRPWQEGNRNVKLADFGFATVIEPNERLTSACGSPHYCSPEVLAGSSAGAPGYRLECDMWACGVIAYSLLCCQYPFDGDTDADVVKAVKEGVLKFPDHVKVSDAAHDFVKSLLQVDISKRLAIDGALSHPWIVNNVAQGQANADLALEQALKKEQDCAAGQEEEEKEEEEEEEEEKKEEEDEAKQVPDTLRAGFGCGLPS
jgi:tRNA A-37 threonylcarbamoyl transferase component Bud32